MWLTPEQGTLIEYRSRIVCGSRKSMRSYSSAITSAYFPSWVKYRLYGSVTGIGAPGWPVAGLIGTRVLPSVSFTYNTEPSHDGVTWFGCPPTGNPPMTLYVFGSMTVTVLLKLFGT